MLHLSWLRLKISKNHDSMMELVMGGGVGMFNESDCTYIFNVYEHNILLY